MKYIFTITFLLITTFGISQLDSRYDKQIFKHHNIYENIIYEEATPFVLQGNAVQQFYTLDFYEPANDLAVTRPVVLLFPDGDFIVGNKEQTELVNLCKTLTTYGYTCACVNYRQGYDDGLRDGVKQAIYRGVQDARAAIRYLLEHQRTFRINPEKIYVGGSRSGGIIALHTAFLDREEERVNFSSNGSCLDCHGNPFEHGVKIAGVINIDGSLYNPNIIANNKNIPILNLHIEQPTNHSLGTSVGADFTPSYRSYFSPLNLHRFLDSLDFDSHYQQFSKDSSIGYVDTETETEETALIANFLKTKIAFQSPTPEGKSEVCINSTSKFSIPYEKDCEYRWEVENGKIIKQYNNTVEVKWNSKVGKGKISVVKIDASGIHGLPSNKLIVEIKPQPVPDFEIEYLSANTIKIKDKSLEANLVGLDLGTEGVMHHCEPQTNTCFTYETDGSYFLMQTAENGCGVSTQSVPIDISIPTFYKSTNINEAIQSISALITKGNNSFINVEKLKNINEFTITIRDTKDVIVSEQVYTIDPNDKFLPIYTLALDTGIYFIEFMADTKVLAVKRVRVK